jgi:hypothetical protein
MKDLAEILHNIADHTETFHRFLSEPGIADDIRGRLIDHIVLEEKENTTRLQELHSAAPTALTQKMLDHSFILQRVMSDLTMPLDLKQELLHHFIEEHQEWQMQIIGTPSGHAEGGTTYNAPESTTTGTHGARSDSTHQHSGASHEGSKTSTQSGAEQQPETREWTVGPLWNQGG